MRNLLFWGFSFLLLSTSPTWAGDCKIPLLKFFKSILRKEISVTGDNSEGQDSHFRRRQTSSENSNPAQGSNVLNDFIRSGGTLF